MKKNKHDIAIETANKLFPALARSIESMASAQTHEIVMARENMKNAMYFAVDVISAAIDEAQSLERAA